MNPKYKGVNMGKNNQDTYEVIRSESREGYN